MFGKEEYSSAFLLKLEKGCSELQWYQTSHAILKKELRMAQDELQLDSVQCDRLEMENAEMSVALQELRLSYEVRHTKDATKQLK